MIVYICNECKEVISKPEDDIAIIYEINVKTMATGTSYEGIANHFCNIECFKQWVSAMK